VGTSHTLGAGTPGTERDVAFSQLAVKGFKKRETAWCCCFKPPTIKKMTSHVLGLLAALDAQNNPAKTSDWTGSHTGCDVKPCANTNPGSFIKSLFNRSSELLMCND
jgi:hypothetical protein